MKKSKLLARAEARLTKEGATFINKELAKIFKERTLEAIKGQRRRPAYQELVRSLLGVVEEPTSDSEVEFFSADESEDRAPESKTMGDIKNFPTGTPAAKGLRATPQVPT